MGGTYTTLSEVANMWEQQMWLVHSKDQDGFEAGGDERLVCSCDLYAAKAVAGTTIIRQLCLWLVNNIR